MTTTIEEQTNLETGYQKAISILGRIKPLKRLDVSIGVGNLAKELGVSLDEFERAIEATGHTQVANHVYFGMKSLKAAVKAYESDLLDRQIEERTHELTTLLKSAGKSLADIHKVRRTTPLKGSGKLSFRFTQHEAQQLQVALQLTGKPNVSAQVKACVEAYPRMHELEKSYQAMQKEFQELKKSVDALPSLILSLSTE